MKSAVLFFLAVLTTLVNGSNVPIDWSRVTPVEELDHYWARLPPRVQVLRKTFRPSRITNGQEAVPGQFPYQALVLSEFGALTTLCGGSVFTQQYILTAGHCVMLDQNTMTGSGTVIVGAHDRMVEEPTQQRIRFSRTGIFVHPQYAASNLRFDVAIIRLASPVVFNDFVQPIRFPGRTDERQFDGMLGTVSGFGQISDSGSTFARILRFTTNPVISNSACVSSWGTLLVEPQNVCLSGEGGRSTCNGDSGGPLTVTDSERTLQIGVTSFGSGTGCASGVPSVYARISYFQDWIRANSDYVD